MFPLPSINVIVRQAGKILMIIRKTMRDCKKFYSHRPLFCVTAQDLDVHAANSHRWTQQLHHFPRFHSASGMQTVGSTPASLPKDCQLIQAVPGPDGINHKQGSHGLDNSFHCRKPQRSKTARRKHLKYSKTH